MAGLCMDGWEGGGLYYIYHTKTSSHVYLMRDENEGRKKQARSNKQTTRQSNTEHPRQSLFLRKAASGGTLHSRQSTVCHTGVREGLHIV